MKAILCAMALWSGAAVGAALNPAQRTAIDDAIVHEAGPGAITQMTTAELRETRARGGAILLDARPTEESACRAFRGP